MESRAHYFGRSDFEEDFELDKLGIGEAQGDMTKLFMAVWTDKGRIFKDKEARDPVFRIYDIPLPKLEQLCWHINWRAWVPGEITQNLDGALQFKLVSGQGPRRLQGAPVISFTHQTLHSMHTVVIRL